MGLKMYEFQGGVTVWICAETKEQAINEFKSYHGKTVWNEQLELYGEDSVREMGNDELFTYYHDREDADEDTIGNHLKKYCTKPDIFAISEF